MREGHLCRCRSPSSLQQPGPPWYCDPAATRLVAHAARGACSATWNAAQRLRPDATNRTKGTKYVQQPPPKKSTQSDHAGSSFAGERRSPALAECAGCATGAGPRVGCHRPPSVPGFLSKKDECGNRKSTALQRVPTRAVGDSPPLCQCGAATGGNVGHTVTPRIAGSRKRWVGCAHS